MLKPDAMKFFLTHYDRVKLVIILSLVASLPFHIFISSILIVVGSLVTLIRMVYLRKFSFRPADHLSISLVFYFFLEVLGLLNTESANLSLGLFTLEKHQALVFIPLLFIDVTLSKENLGRIFSVFIASCLVGSLVCIGVNVYRDYTTVGVFIDEWGFSHDRLSAPIDMQAVYFSMYLSLCILMLLFTLKEKWWLISKSTKVLLLSLTFYFLGFVVALGARTMIVALMSVIISYIVYTAVLYKNFKILISAVMIPLVFAGFVFLNPVVTTRFLDLKLGRDSATNYEGYFARLDIWRPGVEVIMENFWIGVGTGDHESELHKKYLKYGFTEGVRLNFNMHNQYLQTMLNFGVLGLVSFTIVLLVQIRASISMKNPLYLSFLALFILGCLTESMLNRNKGIVFFILFSFIFYRTQKREAIYESRE